MQWVEQSRFLTLREWEGQSRNQKCVLLDDTDNILEVVVGRRNVGRLTLRHHDEPNFPRSPPTRKTTQFPPELSPALRTPPTSFILVTK